VGAVGVNDGWDVDGEKVGFSVVGRCVVGGVGADDG